MNTATYRVLPGDAGVASATAQTQQQIGTSIGLAVLNTVAVNATTHYSTVAGGSSNPALPALALVHGFASAFWWDAGLFVLGAVICGILFHNGRLVGEA